MFQTQVVEEIKIPLIFGKFSENFAVEKYCRAGQATDDNIIRRKRLAC